MCYPEPWDESAHAPERVAHRPCASLPDEADLGRTAASALVEAVKPGAAAVDYPVYGSTALVTYLEAGMITQSEAIEAAGLHTVQVTGADTAGTTGGSHAWNKVRVGGRWLPVDYAS